MAAFSPNATVTLSGFVARIGLPWRPGPSGSASYQFERSGLVTFTPSEDGQRVILSLAAPSLRPNETTERQLLENAGQDANLNRFVHTGLSRNGDYHWAVIFDNDELSEPLIDRCLQRLIELRRAIP